MPDATVTSVERYASVIVVHVLPDRLDENSLSVVRGDALAAGGESPTLPVVLDMARVGFMPSLSLGGLVQLLREFKSRGQRLVLTGLQPPVRETIAITRLDRLFEIQDDVSMLKGGSKPVG